MAPAVSPPGLIEATKNSTVAWQDNLQSLFNNAKDRFPDVVWELQAEDEKAKSEEVWGHKAIVYARAPPSFQARYFSFRPAPVASPLPYSNSPFPAQSTLSLSVGLDISRSPSPFRVASPTPSNNPGTLLRLPTSINPILFSNELEYLYTGKGFGEAFEFLFDTSESRAEGDAEENRIDKLRKDLVFMWRSRLYSDVRIALTGSFSSTNHESTTAIFSSHRFILVSRSPYFHSQLLSWGVPQQSKSDEPLTITLPSPPFTPASLHFTLGFIYTGTLIFSHRTYDLDTAFHIMRSATYLALDSLYDEIQARIVQEMLHGLFHAFLEFAEYERITGGKWGTGGCRCRQCARRAPRTLEFALADDVKNAALERGARRALVGLFGEGWCTSEFAGLPQRLRESLLKGLAKRTTPMNVFALLFAAHHGLEKMNAVIDPWADVVREMLQGARKTIDEVLCTRAEECFEQPDWLEMMESDGVRFEDGEQVELIMDSVRRGLNEKNAGTVYQTLVSSILLRPHLTEPDSTMLSATSHIRIQVEEARVDVLRWMRKRWVGIRQENGFDALDGWALKEISGEIEVPVEDLLNPSQSSLNRSTTKAGQRPSMVKADDATDTTSMHSLHKSVVNRQIPTRSASGAASIRSVARSTQSTASSRVNSMSPAARTGGVPSGPRPDSKLTPSPSARSTLVEGQVTPKPRVMSPTGAARSVTSRTVASSRKSTASSIRSHTTVRNGSTAGPSTLRVPSADSRPASVQSTNSDGSTTFKTANSEMRASSAASRSQRVSAASTSVSNAKTTTGSPATTKITRPRRPSAANSTTSTISTAAKSTKRPAGTLDAPKLTPSSSATKRPASTMSVRSTASTNSNANPAKKATPIRKTAATEKKTPIPTRINGHTPASSIKGKERDTHISTPSTESTLSVKTLRRKGSSDTITKSTAASTAAVAAASTLKQQLAFTPRGATLEIGIPCIISSKRKRFRAYARYIGEVEGELGPWVGVEVPVGDSWPGEKLEGRDWNDGTWGGVRYFEIGGAGSEWGDYGDAPRRRVDYTSSKGLKREGDQLSVERAKRMRSASPAVSDVSTSESRGLFVRPQQVLYVVDAVGADL